MYLENRLSETQKNYKFPAPLVNIRNDLQSDSHKILVQETEKFLYNSDYKVIISKPLDDKTLPHTSRSLSDLVVHDLDITQHFHEVHSLNSLNGSQELSTSELIRGVTHGGVIKKGNVNIPLDDYNI